MAGLLVGLVFRLLVDCALVAAIDELTGVDTAAVLLAGVLVTAAVVLAGELLWLAVLLDPLQPLTIRMITIIRMITMSAHNHGSRRRRRSSRAPSG